MRPHAVRTTALLLAVLALPTAAAYPDPDKAPGTHPMPCLDAYGRRIVFDFIGLLEEPWPTQVEGGGCDVYKATSAHAVLVLVRDTDGESLESYALHLFERWGIGDDERDDGVLLLYVQQGTSGRPELRLEVGYGLEGVLNGRASAAIIDEVVAAHADAVAAGDGEAAATGYALAKGMLLVDTALLESYDDGFPQPVREPRGWSALGWPTIALLVVVFLLVAGGAARSSRRWGYRSNDAAWAGVLAWLLLRGGGRGGGGFGGGGWGGGGGFGGGGFGGGRSGGGGGSGRF